MAEYVAVSTTNAQQNGWEAIVTGNNKKAIEEAAKRRIESDHTVRSTNTIDIYGETLLRNLRVVSKSEAKRKYKVIV